LENYSSTVSHLTESRKRGLPPSNRRTWFLLGREGRRWEGERGEGREGGGEKVGRETRIILK
jgi:hypothetical protein